MKMTMKKKIHIIIACVMIICLPLLMAYSLIGEAAHEYKRRTKTGHSEK